METLFTDDFPNIREAKNPVAALEKIKKQYRRLGYDDYYIVSGCLPERREKFDKLWETYRPFADSHFLNSTR